MTPDCPTPPRFEREPIAEGTVMAGKYCLERLLGSGAQGWVWAARNLDLDLPVAIKLIRSEGSDDPQPAQRLFREARSAARLGHPAIVRVFDLGEHSDGSPFIVLERLQGETLSDRLSREGALSPELAVRTMLPIADALLATHAEGIIHRDVKPANVFLAVHGSVIQPKLMDFGIARFVGGTGSSNSVTQRGAIVGTPSYVSPEQARGLSDVDHRSDLWSFCTTLYECMTLCLPFNGNTWPELCRSILEDEPRSLPDAGIEDDALWRIVRRGLEKVPEARWANLFVLGRELASWLLRRGVTNDVSGTSLETRWLRDPPSARVPERTFDVESARWREPPPGPSARPVLDVTRPTPLPGAVQPGSAPHPGSAVQPGSTPLPGSAVRSGSTVRSLTPGGAPPRKGRTRRSRDLLLAATALSALGAVGFWYARASNAQAPLAQTALAMARLPEGLSPAAALALLPVANSAPTPPPIPTPTVPSTAQPQPPPPPTEPRRGAVPAGASEPAKPATSMAPPARETSSPGSSTPAADEAPRGAPAPEPPRARPSPAEPPDLLDPYAVPKSSRSSNDESRLPSTASVLGATGDDWRRIDRRQRR